MDCTGLRGCPVHPDGAGLDGHIRTVDGKCVHCGRPYPCSCPEPVECGAKHYGAIMDVVCDRPAYHAGPHRGSWDKS